MQELREIFGIKEYENELIIEKNILNNFELIIKKEVFKQYGIDEENLEYLLNMTPLMKNRKKVKKISKITIALNVYVLGVKNNGVCYPNMLNQ